jgi:hypothetical protein
MCQKFRSLGEPLVSASSGCWTYCVLLEAGNRAEGLFLVKIFMTASNTCGLGKSAGA